MKKKALILTILSSMTLAAGGLAVALGSGELGFIGGKAGTAAPGEISYSPSNSKKSLGSDKYTFKQTTLSGTNIYLYSVNDSGISTSRIASIRYNQYTEKGGFVTFTADENGETPFVFQNITSLSLTTESKASDNVPFSIYTSISASSPSYSGTVNAGETKVISAIAGATYIKIVSTSSSYLDITSLTINYSCDPEIQPGEKVLTGIRVKDDYKQNYAQNAQFVEPTVYADYIQDDVPSTEIVTAEFTGYNMSQLGVQPVTASFGGKTTQFDIHVKRTEQSKLISYQGWSNTTHGDNREVSTFLDVNNSKLPAYGEPGESLSFTPVFKSGFSYVDTYDEGYKVDEYTYSAGVVTFTVPTYYDVDVVIVFDEVLTLDSMHVDNPKIEYTVGSSFVVPTVMGVYTNPNGTEFEYELSVTASNFSGFDSSVAVASQTITVSYTGLQNITYTISIIKSSGQYLEGVYVLNYDSSIKWKLEFNSDGSGVYRKYNASGDVIGTDTFNYEFDGTNLTFTNVTCTYNNWGNYYLTHGTAYNVRETTNSGTVLDDVISITTYNTSGSVTRAATYTLAA